MTQLGAAAQRGENRNRARPAPHVQVRGGRAPRRTCPLPGRAKAGGLGACLTGHQRRERAGGDSSAGLGQRLLWSHRTCRSASVCWGPLCKQTPSALAHSLGFSSLIVSQDNLISTLKTNSVPGQRGPGHTPLTPARTACRRRGWRGGLPQRPPAHGSPCGPGQPQPSRTLKVTVRATSPWERGKAASRGHVQGRPRSP